MILCADFRLNQRLINRAVLNQDNGVKIDTDSKIYVAGYKGYV